MAALLFHDEMTRFGGDDQKALAALSMGDSAFEAMLQKHPMDWQKQLNPRTKGMLRDYALTKDASAEGLSTMALPGTGVVVMVMNETGGNAAIALHQLGAR
jgi:hypothetical protein